MRLQELSEQLDPCENAYADVRFIETDWEQTNEEFETYLTNLHNEISEERGITEGITKVLAEIDHLINDIPSLAKESLIDIQEKAISPLRTEIERLSKLDTDSHRNRRIVAREKTPSLNDVNNRLAELENATHQRIQDLDNLDNEKRIIETRQQLDLLQQQPDITEESFIQLHEQLSQLPENDPHVVELQKQVEEVQAKADARNSLKSKLNDNINAKIDELKNIQQNVMVIDEPESGKKRGKKSKVTKEPQILGNTRDEQIANLHNAIDNIETNVTPTLNELARKASDNGIDVPQLEAEEQKANELLQKLKTELAKKEKEHENVQKAQQDVHDLTTFIDEVSAAQPILADPNNLNTDNAQSTLDDLTKRATDLKQYLDRTEEVPETVFETFNDDERHQYNKSRDDANDLLKKLLEKCNDLQKQLDNISEWNKKKSELDDQANDISNIVQSLENEFGTHQSLASAKDGVRRAEALEPRLKEAEKQLKKTNDWLQKQLPNNDEVKQQLDELHNKLDELKKTREALINRLEQDIEHENKLVTDQNALIDNINKLGEDAIAVHKLDDLDNKPAALAAIHERLQPIEEKLEQLEKRSHDPNTIIDHSDTLNIPLIRNRLNDIAQSLNEQEKDAADKLALAGISSNLNRELTALRDAVDRAERIDNDPAATINDLHKVHEILDNSMPSISEVEKLLQQLDTTTNPDANNLQNQATDDLSQLRQRLDATRQSAIDRANELQQFNNDLDNIAKQLDDVTKAIHDVKPDDSQVNLDIVNVLKQQNANNGDILKSKEAQLNNLLPLTQPATRYNSLLQQQLALDDQLTKLHENVEKETAKRQELQAYTDQLNKAEDDLANAERDIDTTLPNDVAYLEQIDEQQLIPINQLITSIDTLPVPNDDIKNRKKAIKKRLQSINDKHSKKLDNARKQNGIIAAIDNDLTNLENAAQDIIFKYANNENKPLTEAIEDRNTLNKIIEQLGPLTIDEIDDKPRRDALSKRAEQLRSQAKSLTTPLNEDISVEEKLLHDYNNLLTKLNDIGINILALGETGITDDEIKKAGDLAEQLRKLGKLTKDNDNKIQKPHNYVQHSYQDAPLTPQLEQLQNQLDEKRKNLENRAKLDTVTPAIELITVNLQQRASELEQALPENLEQQQEAYNDLADQKRKLEDLLEKIPQGPEGNEIREKSQWDLSRITDLLKKLGNAVGEKAAALAAFIASKRAIDDQLNTLNNDITAAESNLDNATPNNLQDRINTLEAEEARINAIRSKLSDEQINRNNLDSDKQQELDELHKALDAAVERLQNARNNLTTQLASAIASEQLQADTNHLYNDLADLIRQAHQTLADPTAIPITYHDLAQRINDKVQDTNQVIQNANASGNPEVIQPLNDLIPQAQNAQNDLNTRYNLWLEFVHERDNANDQVDQARNVLNDFEAHKDLRPLDVAEAQLENLKVNLTL